MKILPNVLQNIGFSKVILEDAFKNTSDNLELKKELLKEIENLLFTLFKRLDGKIVWNEFDFENIKESELVYLPFYITGTNKVAINNLGNALKDLLFLDEKNDFI